MKLNLLWIICRLKGGWIESFFTTYTGTIYALCRVKGKQYKVRIGNHKERRTFRRKALLGKTNREKYLWQMFFI